MLKEQLFLLKNLILILTAAFFGGVAAKKFKQPPLLGYLLAGVLVGVFFKGNLLVEPSVLAEIGIAFLMFALGIELSFDKAKRDLKKAFLGGLIQILIIILIGFLILPYFGFSFYLSLFLASCFSLSSTAMVVKMLSEKGEIGTLSGRISIAWLFLQNLAVLPMMIILSSIGHQWAAKLGFFHVFLKFIWAVLKASIFLFLVVIVGRKVAPFILRKIGQLESYELMLVGVIAFCLAFALGSFYLGLSFAYGAFLAGFLVSETEEEITFLSQTRLLRNLFSIIFFVSLGVLINLQFVFKNLPLILGVSFLFMFLKFLVVFFIVLYLGFHPKVAFFTGAYLFQVGEFAFVLAFFGKRLNLINQYTQNLIFTTTTLTIGFSPLIINSASRGYGAAFKRLKESPKLAKYLSQFDQGEFEEELPFSNHVVLAGYSRVGRHIGRGLEMVKIPYVVIDYNHQLITRLKEKGVNAIYGDPCQIEVLGYAKIEKAKAVVVVTPDREGQKTIITNCLSLNPKIKIIVWSHFEEDRGLLKALGAETIIQPEFEAALSITHRLYHLLKVPFLEIPGKIKKLKIEHGV